MLVLALVLALVVAIVLALELEVVQMSVCPSANSHIPPSPLYRRGLGNRALRGSISSIRSNESWHFIDRIPKSPVIDFGATFADAKMTICHLCGVWYQ